MTTSVGSSVQPHDKQARVRQLGRLAAYAVVAICLAVMAVQIARHAGQIREVDWQFGWQTGVATFCIMFGQVAIGWISLCWLGCLGVKPYWKDVLRIHLVSQPLKYLPIGGIFNVTGQTAALGRLPGVGLPRSATAVALMQAIVFAGGVAWYGLTLCLQNNGNSTFGLLMIGVLPASLILLSMFRFWQGLPLRLVLKGSNQDANVRFRIAPDVPRLIAIALLGLIAWGLFGLSLVLITAQVITISVKMAMQLTGVMAAAWIVGFLSFVAPAGLGVRDVTMMVLLQPLLGEPLSVVIPVVSRLLWIVADLGNFFVGVIILRLRSLRPSPSI